MLTCEGYKLFYGTATVVPVNAEPYDVTGTWLYKPEYGCWYCNGSSYPQGIIENIREVQHT